jgi:hypothetical protein
MNRFEGKAGSVHAIPFKAGCARGTPEDDASRESRDDRNLVPILSMPKTPLRCSP